MKKYVLCLLIIMLITFLPKLSAKKSYTAFQDLFLSKGKLLKDFTTSEYSAYYKKVNKRKFCGWRIYEVNKEIKTKFISDTVFSYYNNGKTEIKYAYSLAEASAEKYSISCSGSIAYTSNTTKKEFKNGLSSSLKMDTSLSISKTKDETKSLEIIIAPMTVANLKIVGEGKLSNGVAARYFFFLCLNKGGYEYFIVTTQYPRLEVLPI